MMTKDKEKEEVVPQDNVEATQEEAPEAYNPFAGWMQSVGDTYKAKEEKVAQEQARYDALLKKMRDAQENKQSVVKALMQEQKPVYDYDAEKREKNKATIKALGDVFSAITAGAHAYSKNGAGVVPTLAENSPLKEIEKINTMQEQYRTQNEAWKALDIKWREQEEEAKVKAAEAMATAAGKDLETAIKEADDARDAITKGLFDIGDAEYKNANANARWAASEEAKDNRHQQTLAARKAGSDDGSKGNKKDNLSDNEKGALMRMYSGYGINSTSTTESPLLSITGKPTGETKKTTTVRTKYMPEFSDQDWGNFAAENNAMISLMRNANKNEGLSEDEVADMMLAVNEIYRNDIARLYNDPTNRYTLKTVRDYVVSNSDGE